MAITPLASIDPEIAAATLKRHFDQLWASGRPTLLAWERTGADPMHVVVTLPARRPSGEVDPYYFRLGATYYDAAPPTVALVQPDGNTLASEPSRWFPVIEGPHWFKLHSAYPWPTGPRQLVCFSFAAEYYMTDHSPQDSERWQQGRHTVAATLFRLAEVLSSKHYRGPSG